MVRRSEPRCAYYRLPEFGPSEVSPARAEMIGVPVRGFVGAVDVGDRRPGVGKSTVCALLKSRGELAVDADWEG